jgi:tetratricopeptide (TPR) repeat protein
LLWFESLPYTKSIEAFETLLRIDRTARANNIGTQWSTRREFARAESLHARDVGADSGMAIAWQNLAVAQIHQSRFKEAEPVIREARRRFPQHPNIQRAEFALIYSLGRLDDAERLVDSMYRNGSPEFRAGYALALSSLRLIRGRYAEAERLRRQSNVVIRARGTNIALVDTLLELMIPAWFRGPSPAIVKMIDDVLVAMPIRALPPPDRP